MLDKDYIKSLEKGLNLISLIAGHGSPLRLEELVKISGLRKTSCFRILQTVTRAGFVVKDAETGVYRIGPKVISIGLAALEGRGVREIALPVMREIRQKTGATVNLAILSGPEVVFIERLQSAHIVEGNLSVGSRLSVHLSSMGKVILAHLPEAELAAVLRQIRFQRKTDQTIMSLKALREELKAIRAAGYALNNEELETGLFAIAVPLRNYSGAAVAGLNISFLLTRHPRQEAMRDFLPLMIKAGREISALMGYNPAGEAGATAEPEPPRNRAGRKPVREKRTVGQSAR